MLPIGSGQLSLTHGRATLHEALAEELLAPRQGTEVVVCRLLEAMLLRALRAEINTGFWQVQGWLGALTDPVVRTVLGEKESVDCIRSVKSLATSSHRSVRRLSARLKGWSGTRPSKLLMQLRMRRAILQLEQSSADLGEVARDNGYSGVSSFCRAFRRETGCTPAQYWRRHHRRPFPRKP